jgi:Trypsin
MIFINTVHALTNKWRRAGNAPAALAALAIVTLSTPAWAIHGGSNAAPGEFPGVVSIERLSGTTWQHTCTGANLGNGAVLTAAHCVAGLSPAALRVKGGSISRSDPAGTQIVNVATYKINENYLSGAGKFPNDIAIINLSNDFPNPDDVGSVHLPPPGFVPPNPGGPVSVVGWGLTELRSLVQPDILQSAVMANISTVAANGLLVGLIAADPIPSPWVVDQQLALYDSTLKVTMDAGDGLAFALSNGQQVLAGIQSWGIASASGIGTLASYPAVTTRVSSYFDWIRENTLLPCGFNAFGSCGGECPTGFLCSTFSSGTELRCGCEPPRPGFKCVLEITNEGSAMCVDHCPVETHCNANCNMCVP